MFIAIVLHHLNIVRKPVVKCAGIESLQRTAARPKRAGDVIVKQPSKPRVE